VLSDLVAEHVVRLRKRAGLRRDQLAAKCQQLGMDELTEAALANIETGRRHGNTGTRRRRVTVDELLGLALALDVPAVSLLADPRHSGPVPVTDALALGPWEALLWITGLAWRTSNGPEPATYRAAADLTWKGYVISEMSENLLPKRPGGPYPARQEDIDRIDRSYLATVRQFLGEIKKMGVELPDLPPHVLQRAAELDVDLLPAQEGVVHQ